jgi:integrase
VDFCALAPGPNTLNGTEKAETPSCQDMLALRQQRRSAIMHDNENPIAVPKRVPWNKGKLIGPRPPLQQRHVWAIRTRLQIEQRVRDLALFNLAIDSKLRGCDVVAVRVDDVAPNGPAIERATVRQRKIGRPVRFELTEQTRQAIDEYLAATGRKPGEYLFGGRRPGRRMTTRQYARLLSGWLVGIGLDPHVYRTHSLRRTKATLIYRRTGNLRAVQLLLGHTKIESTVRYLGIDVDDALAISEQVEI